MQFSYLICTGTYFRTKIWAHVWVCPIITCVYYLMSHVKWCRQYSWYHYNTLTQCVTTYAFNLPSRPLIFFPFTCCIYLMFSMRTFMNHDACKHIPCPLPSFTFCSFVVTSTCLENLLICSLPWWIYDFVRFGIEYGSAQSLNQSPCSSSLVKQLSLRISPSPKRETKRLSLRSCPATSSSSS